MAMNAHQRNLLYEESLKTAWTETITSVHMPNRVNEINMRDSKSALSEILERLEHENARETTSANRLGQAKIPRTMNVNDYKLPRQRHIGSIKSTKYDTFVERLERDNPAKNINREVVEACFWKSVEDALKASGTGGAAGGEVIRDAHAVLAGAKRYWEED